MKDITVFSKKDKFMKNIKPKVEELIVECRKEGIPLFVSLCYAGNEEKSNYFSSIVSPKILDIKLVDDYLSEYLKVARGMKVSTNNDFYVGKKQDDDIFSTIQEMSAMATFQENNEEKDIITIESSDDDYVTDLYEKEK